MVSEFVAAVADLQRGERLGAHISVIDGPGTGESVVVDRDRVRLTPDREWLDESVLSDATVLMDREESKALEYGSRRIFIDVVAPPPVMLIFGAGHIAQPLSLFAGHLGYRVVVSDARATWATEQRFPHVDNLIVGWPDDVFAEFEPDHRTYVVLLSHDPRFEVPVFASVHGKKVRYLGALGSRRTHRMRLERLGSEGWSREELAEIRGPIGLDLKAKSPAETAVAILAEIIQVRYGAGTGDSLVGTDVPIHSVKEADADI